MSPGLTSEYKASKKYETKMVKIHQGALMHLNTACAHQHRTSQGVILSILTLSHSSDTIIFFFNVNLCPPQH